MAWRGRLDDEADGFKSDAGYVRKGNPKRASWFSRWFLLLGKWGVKPSRSNRNLMHGFFLLGAEDTGSIAVGFRERNQTEAGKRLIVADQLFGTRSALTSRHGRNTRVCISQEPQSCTSAGRLRRGCSDCSFMF